MRYHISKRKLSMTDGMALFGMFAVDDLARVAILLMEKHQETKAIAKSIAKDFKNIGVAFASGGSPRLDCCDLIQLQKENCRENAEETYNAKCGASIWNIALNIACGQCATDADNDTDSRCAADCSFK